MNTAERIASVQEYYFSQKLREVKELMLAGKPIINMGIGSPDLPPPPAALDALNQSLMNEGAHQYQSYQGLPELRKAMVDFYQSKFEVTLNPDTEILPLMGSKEGIMHVSMAFLNFGDKVLIPNPGYPTYNSVARLLQTQIISYDLKEANGWLPNLKEIEEMNLKGVKMMWISYPNMPTGATIGLSQMRDLVAFAKRNNILLVNDNPYSFVLNNHPTSIFQIPGAMEVALELNSLSKTFNMAGWRVGMVMGNAAHLQAVLKVKSNMDSGMFLGIQKGAVAALQSGEDWFKSLDITYAQRRELVWQMAESLGCTFDKNAAGMFVWAKLPKGSLDSESYIDAMLHNHSIFIAPGTIFGSQGAGYIRFSLCVSAEKIREALTRIQS